MAYYDKKQLESIRKGLEYAKSNPDDPKSQEITKRLKSGQLNFELKALGLKPVPVKQPKVDLSKITVPQGQQSIPTQSRLEKQVSGAAKDFGSDFMEMGQNIRESFKKRTEGLGEDIARRAEDGTTLRESLGTGLGFAAATLGTAVDAITEGGMFIGKAFLTDEQEKAIGDSLASGVGSIIARSEGSKGREDVEKLVAAYNKWAEDNPEAASNVEDAGSIVMSLAELVGLKGGGKLSKEVIDTSTDVVKRNAPKVKETIDAGNMAAEEALRTGGRKLDEIFSTSNKQLENKIQSAYQKGVKPTIQGKQNIGQVEKYKENVQTAVSSIIDRKDNINYTDEIGVVTTGHTPKSLNEFSQAIQQSKNNIFDEYDALAKQAGKEGLVIDGGQLGNELDSIIDSQSLKLTSPEAVSYAKVVKERYQNIGAIDAETAQDVIKQYNNSLQAFYKNPTPEGATRNAVDALMVNQIRQKLDEGIEGLTGAEYQTLKNQYAALKTIEKDVLNATLRDARKNQAGLIDYTDIFTGGQAVAAIASMNPATMAGAATQKGIKEYLKWLNDPNTQVQKLFKAGEQLKEKGSVEPGFFEKAFQSFNTGEIPQTNIVNTYKGSFDDFERLPLTGELARQQESTIKQYMDDPVGMVQKYIDSDKNFLIDANGKKVLVANTDEVRKLFPEYDPQSPMGVHEASSRVAKDVLATGLKNEGKYATAFAGGAGSGKTSVIKSEVANKIADTAVILDGTLAKTSSLDNFIDQAVKAGKVPEVSYAYRDPYESFMNGMIKRALTNPDEGGRVVPINAFIQGHEGSLSTIKELLSNPKYANVELDIIDNSLGAGNQRLVTTLDDIDNIVYTIDRSRLEEMVKDTAKQIELYGKRLTDKQIKAILE